ncbi:MAG: phosphopentomutase [Rhodobacteraceae bacterium]|nr:phosphopentomutase [Paracoccaceae bacterium]
MARAFVVVMDSVGIGGAVDAARFFNGDKPDTGSNTLGHITEACTAGRADEGRSGPLLMPNLNALGLSSAVKLASGLGGSSVTPTGAWGAANEVSNGKDTPSGHWEIAGVPVPFDWTYFPVTEPAFPPDLTEAICKAAGVSGILGNKHASGTVILEELGGEHMRSGLPIVYTSADSVVQIAAHEETFGLERLLELCQAVAPMVHAMRVGRVIARPFLGNETVGFTRTINRHDYALAPPSPTLCDWAHDAGRKVYAVGKIGDIFAHHGISEERKGADATLMEHLVDLMDEAEDGSLTFANFVEFDARFGHRRDVAGYASALEWFDREVPRILARARPDDLILFTADHGNDPTWPGTDHTRERVPVIVHGIGARALGQVAFADIGASVAAHLGLSERGAGRSFL